jgi:hypothetical protein
MPRAGVITGVQQVLRAIGKAKKETGESIESGLRGAAEIVLKKALQYVPRDTQALAASGKIVTTGRGVGTKVNVEFGGDTAPYGLYVHEDMSAYHSPPTCAKFLEKAVRETRGPQKKRVQREIEAKQRTSGGSYSPG